MAKPRWTTQSRSDKAKAYWRRNVTVITVLLDIWASVSYVFGILFADVLATASRSANSPLASGLPSKARSSSLSLLIFVYCWIMDRVDKEFDVQEA
jgi:putative solute:sodium symporter small subunit